MKKRFVKIFSSLLILGVSTSGVNVFADENSENYKALPSKVTIFEESILKSGETRGNLFSSEISVYKKFLGNYFVVVTSDAATDGNKYKVDYIKAEVKFYNARGVYVNGNIDENYYSSHAGTEVDTKTNQKEGTGYGYHTYKRAGHNTINSETSYNLSKL